MRELPNGMKHNEDYAGYPEAHGRLLDQDERDTLPEHCAINAIEFRKYHYMTGKRADGPPPGRTHRIVPPAILNQGVYPYAPAYAWRMWLSAAPDPTMLGPDAHTLYHESRQFLPDIIAAENPEGTSIRACAKALFIRGHIDSYVWMHHPDDAIEWLRNGMGTIVVGFRASRKSLFTPSHDRNGNTDVKDAEVYSTAALLCGWDEERKAFRFIPPYGYLWGYRGRRWMPYEHLRHYLSTDGELCAAPTKRYGTAASALVRDRMRTYAMRHGVYPKIAIPQGLYTHNADDRDMLDRFPARNVRSPSLAQREGGEELLLVVAKGRLSE